MRIFEKRLTTMSTTTKTQLAQFLKMPPDTVITVGMLMQILRELNATSNTVDTLTGGAAALSGATVVATTSVTTPKVVEGTASAGVVIESAAGNITLLPNTGWQPIAGTATKGGFDTGTVTLPELAQVVKAMLDQDITDGFKKP